MLTAPVGQEFRQEIIKYNKKSTLCNKSIYSSLNK